MSDSDWALDWEVAEVADIGVLNDGMALPFGAGLREVSLLPTTTSAFSSGTWAGSVVVLEAGDDVFLRAEHERGPDGTTDPFAVRPPMASPLTVLVVK